jgi:hypothetical protein
MEYGPVTPLELLDLIRNGTVLRDTPLKKDDSQWVMAQDVNGLFASAAKPSIAYFCPGCGKEISKPPSRCSKCDVHVDRANQKLVHHDLEAIDRKARKAMERVSVPAKELRKTDRDRAGRRDEVVSQKSTRRDLGEMPSSKMDSRGERSGKWLSWLRGKR